MPHLITPRILHDQPLDQPDDRAEFHFDDYANTFARLVTDRTTRTPLVILVSGKWGSGKTTLLRKTQSKLDETERLGENLSKVSFVNPDEEANAFRRCRTVWFNAWKYADEDQLLVALVRVIVQTMYADDFISKAASKIFDPAYPRRDVINTVLGWFSIKTPFGDVKPNTGEPKATPFAEKAALLDLFRDAFDRLSAAWVHRSLDAKEIDPAQGVMAVF
ncbi:MAG: P-loop NTPase fold protein, partial [Chloroflexota bacterium]